MGIVSFMRQLKKLNMIRMNTLHLFLFASVFCLLNSPVMIGQDITGSGTANYIPKFTGTGIIGNSYISQDTGTVIIHGNISGIQSGGALRIYTASNGYLDLGPKNTMSGYCNFETNQNNFYFNNPIQVNGSIGSYTNTDLLLVSNGASNKITFSISNNESMRINSSGQVLINSTCASLPSDCKLAVNGTIYTTNINIKLTTCWSDFVFKKGYSVMSLYELEKYITTNSHLPGIPSEREVQENGLDVARTNALLLQKIEELTLYVIEQNKKIIEQDRKIEGLQKKINNQ